MVYSLIINSTIAFVFGFGGKLYGAGQIGGGCPQILNVPLNAAE